MKKRKKEIIKEFKSKINFLKLHNKLYFTDDNPKISDYEYDKIKREVLDLRKKHNFIKKLKENLDFVGAPPSNKFKKIKHLYPMLSLSNAFNEIDMENFLKRLRIFLIAIKVI